MYRMRTSDVEDSRWKQLQFAAMKWFSMLFLTVVMTNDFGVLAAPLSSPGVQTLARLRRPISVETDGQPLKDVLATIGDEAGLAIKCDWDALAMHGKITSATRVKLKLHKVRADTVLRLLFKSVADEKFKMDFVIGHQSLAISSGAAFAAQKKTQSIDLEDLDRQVRKNDIGTIVFASRRDLIHRVVALIETHIDHSIWETNGGRAGNIVVDPTKARIDVTAPAPTLQRVEMFITDLQLIARKGTPRRDTRTAGADTRAASQLLKVVPAGFKKTPLIDVINSFQKNTGANIFVNWAKLKAAGIEKGRPVTINVPAIPADKLLEVLIDELTLMPDKKRRPIDFVIHDGVIYVSDFDDLNSLTDRRYHEARAIYRKASMKMSQIRRAKVMDLIHTSVGRPQRWRTGENGDDAKGLWAASEFLGVIIVQTIPVQHNNVATVIRRNIPRR